TVAAALLETTADRLGGELGAALLVCAAGLNEIAHDFSAAAEQRFLAARLDDQRASASVGLIRDLARLEGAAAVPAIEDLMARFPPSPLKAALARWGAAAARRTGDGERAWRFVADPARLDAAPPSAALARDRMDLWSGGAGAIDNAITPVAATWSAPTARACLAARACELATDGDGMAAALALAEQVLVDLPDAVALGPAIESLAARAPEANLRRRALAVWRRVDPARWATASFDLAEASSREPEASVEGDTGRAVAAGSTGIDVWREIESSAVTTTVFWRLSALCAARQDAGGAAAHIDRALERSPWAGGPLAAPLAELAAELTARTNVAAAVARLEDRVEGRGDDRRGGAGDAEGTRPTRERLLRRLGDRERWAAHVDQEAAVATGDETAQHRRAALLLAPVFWRRGAAADDHGPALASLTLDLISMEPAALGLVLAARPDAAALADRLDAVAAATGSRRWTVAAAVAAAVGGDPRRGLALAADACRPPEAMATAGGDQRPAPVVADEPASTAAALVRRLAWSAADPFQRAALLRALATGDCRADALVEGGEAAESEGDLPLAARLFQAATDAPGAAAVTADARAGLARSSADGALSAHAAGNVDRLQPIENDARAGRWDGVVARLVDAPPHEDAAGAGTLSLAADIDEGRAGGLRAVALWSRARAAWTAEAEGASSRADDLPGVAVAVEPQALRRAADPSDADAGDVAAALETLAEVVARAPDGRSAALYLLESAWRAGAASAAADLSIERRFRAAVSHDPLSAPAAMAWRRWLVQAGRLDEAAAVGAAEAEALVDPTVRVEALLRAAALLSAAVGVDDWGTRAAACRRRALETIPHHHEAFTRLRDLYEESGRHADLVALLGTRLATTTNPFEVTALRLARAEIFAGSLADRAHAKAELEAILQKEPQHARALERLADFEQQDGNDAGAADVLIRRAFTERSPDKLRELFLRLGRIYTQRAPDAKRAVGAYTRVLQLDPNNREALDELSRLYVGLGETKSAVSITERLLRIETDPERRAEYHVRLGHLAERGSDPRAASLHFHRAVEESPRDIEALGELVRHLDKTRDTSGRRALLDRAASDLRAAVIVSPGDAALLEALVAVSRWRGRKATAAAAAELLALATAGAAGEPPRPPDWATPPRGGRRLAALAKPSVDEQTFGATVPPAVRHLFRLLGPMLWEGGRSDLASYGLDRGDRVPAGQPPRDVLDAVAGDLAAGPFDVYVVPARSPSGRTPLVVEPGRPTTILMGAPLVKLGPHAVRFAAARVLRLASTHLDIAVAGDSADLGAWLGGVVRQFVADYRHPDVSADAIAARAARVAKLLPRKLRGEVMPFAMESSGPLDLAALHAGILDGVNRVGLIASGSLTASLRVLLAIADNGAGTAPLSAEAIGRYPEALALATFALSDEHDDLIRSLE
ncbi:MAG: hypothetical protein ABUR63_02710, partial [Verrucomicrobiota bacterium]